MDFSTFQVITFDCYGTLIDWEAGILGALHPILSAHGAHLGEREILRLYGEIEREEESGGYRDYKEILRSVVRAFGRRLRFEPSEKEAQSLPDSLAQWQPFPDTVPALGRLKSRFQLGIISNIDDDLFRRTSRLLGVDFDYVITAAQAQAYKPSLEIFRLAEKRIAPGRDEWLHAGQSLYHDVVPAQSLGISTVWVNRPSAHPNAVAQGPFSARPDAEVRNLEALAALAC
ncbi:MAG: haloacid dehalogenase type II [Acidobacteria bacterium]|nr:haloacid dehalogenase type II [Acidobacteriota bacterium]